MKLINKDIIAHMNVTDSEIASLADHQKNKANFDVADNDYRSRKFR